jgi:hypothetical protein
MAIAVATAAAFMAIGAGVANAADPSPPGGAVGGPNDTDPNSLINSIGNPFENVLTKAIKNN